MARRTYGQYCGLAAGLDVIGERWTLLIVRELMGGPKRYVDLADALDGIGTSLLATRLRQLEEDGIAVKRQLPKPAASLVYELTASGKELAHALLPLALWGVRHQLGNATEADHYRAEWSLVFIAQLIDPDTAREMNHTYVFHIDESTATLRIDRGDIQVTDDATTDNPDAVITADREVLQQITGGHLTLTDAITDGRINVTGDATAAAQLIAALPDRVAAFTTGA